MNIGKETKGLPIPEALKTYMTVEDREDNEIIEEIESKIAKGIPLKTSDWMDITDGTKRNQYRKIAQGPLGSGIQTTALRDQDLESAVGEKVKMLGIQGTKSSEYNIMLANAKAQYNSIYMQYADNERFENPNDLHDYVITRVEKMVDRGQISGVRSKPEDPRRFTRELTEGREWLLEGHNNGSRSEALLQSELIPGSELQYKRLEKYAKNPNNLDIPLYYKRIASGIKGVSPWEVANYQYMSQNNGKELPKPFSQQALEKSSPILRYFATHHPSYNRIERGRKIDNNHDFNSDESLIPGIK